MSARHYFSGFQKLLSFYMANPRMEIGEQVAIFMFKYARQVKFYAVPVRDQASSIQLLEQFLLKSTDSSLFKTSGIMDVVQSVYTMTSSLYTELGKLFSLCFVIVVNVVLFSSFLQDLCKRLLICLHCKYPLLHTQQYMPHACDGVNSANNILFELLPLKLLAIEHIFTRWLHTTILNFKI